LVLPQHNQLKVLKEVSYLAYPWGVY